MLPFCTPADELRNGLFCTTTQKRKLTCAFPEETPQRTAEKFRFSLPNCGRRANGGPNRLATQLVSRFEKRMHEKLLHEGSEEFCLTPLTRIP
jgi:hypothetical protein